MNAVIFPLYFQMNRPLLSAVVAVLLKITQLIESLIKKNAPRSLAAAHQT